MKVVIEFFLPEEYDKYSDCLHGSRYKEILSRIESLMDAETVSLIEEIKRDVMAGGPIEKSKNQGLE